MKKEEKNHDIQHRQGGGGALLDLIEGVVQT